MGFEWANRRGEPPWVAPFRVSGRLATRVPILVLVVAVIGLSACGGPPAVGPASPVPASAPVDTPSVLTFSVEVAFTGAVALRGSFEDTSTGRGFGSCEAYSAATLWHSPGAMTGTERVGGVPIAFDFALPPGQFDGPGTYSPGVMGRLTIGSQSFVGTASAVTVRADGSGHGSFTGFQHETGPAGTPESGTVKWTCAD